MGSLFLVAADLPVCLQNKKSIDSLDVLSGNFTGQEIVENPSIFL